MDILLGTARTSNERSEPAYVARITNHWVSFRVTPSEGIPFSTCRNAWAQHLWLDAATSGDFLCGGWGVFIFSSVRLECLSRHTGSSEPTNRNELYKIYGLWPCADGKTTYTRRVIPNSCGQVVTYIDSRGAEKYSINAQLGTRTLCDVRSYLPAWNWVRSNIGPSFYSN